MNFTRVLCIGLAAFFFVSQAPAAPADETAAQIHWLGIKQITSDPNSLHFFTIWNLPETARWKSEFLDKVSRVPWQRTRGGDLNTTNPASVLLRPLLDDVFPSECYLEVRGTDSDSGQLAFAIHLDDARAKVWQANLPNALTLLTQIQPVPDKLGWSLKKHHAPDFIQYARVGNWTVLGAAKGSNPLFAEFVTRIEQKHAPFASAAKYPWLQADADLVQTLRALSVNWTPPVELPRISMTVTGDRGFVRTHANLDFAQPLNLQMEPWQLPTNLIRSPIESFTAVRGIAPWLASKPAWNNFQVGPPPNQFFLESFGRSWAQTLFAARVPDAPARLDLVTTQLVNRGTAWLAENGMGRFQRAKQFNGVVWGNIPFMTPDLQATSDFLFGGLIPVPPEKIQAPQTQALVQGILGLPDLVYYDWELTGQHMNGLLHVTQLFRMFFDKAQLPATSPSIKWFAAAAPGLTETVTTVEKTGPARLFLNRRSDTGLTALELHVLADWIESPTFPAGLNTFTAPAPKRIFPPLPPMPAR